MTRLLLSALVMFLLAGCGADWFPKTVVPNAPTGVTATPGAREVTLTWPAVTDATSYNIYWSTTSGVTTTTGTKVSAVKSPYTQGGLTTSTTYYFIITAVAGSAESAPSSQVSATPAISLASFVATEGKMGTARVGHTATLLGTGPVLVTGGSNADKSTVYKTAELYDPTTRTFTATGSMNIPRYNHAAVSLTPSKQVLIVGGIGADGKIVASGEVYDPSTKTFTLTTGSLNTPRSSFSLAQLGTNSALIAGGTDNTGTVLDTAEEFDFTGRKFVPVTAKMTSKRSEHSAVGLSSGKVLLSGGKNQSGAVVASAEIYDQNSHTFTATPHPMNTARTGHSATLLPLLPGQNNGKVVIVGGTGSGGTMLGSAEIYDIDLNTFTTTPGSLTTARSLNSAAVFIGSTVLIAGGKASATLGSAEVFNAVTGAFSPLTAQLLTPRFGHTATLVTDSTGLTSILIAGGVGSSGAALNSAEIAH